MKAVYPRLAFDGIRKNKRLYLPYILTCIGTVTMFYIIHHLAAMPALKSMPGGDSTVMILGLGVWVVAFFFADFFSLHQFVSYAPPQKRVWALQYTRYGQEKFKPCAFV